MPSGTGDHVEPKGSDVDASEGFRGEHDGNGSVTELSLESDDTVVHGSGFPQDGREASQRVADVDGILVSGVDVGESHRSVDGQVEKVHGAGIAVSGRRGASHGGNHVGQEGRIGNAPIAGLVEVGGNVEVGHGEDQPGQDG